VLFRFGGRPISPSGEDGADDGWKLHGTNSSGHFEFVDKTRAIFPNCDRSEAFVPKR
jgi:hypothetical protein